MSSDTEHQDENLSLQNGGSFDSPQLFTEEFVDSVNLFFEEHQFDSTIFRNLHRAYIHQECQKGSMKYKNGRNLKDGVEIVNKDKLRLFNPMELYTSLKKQ
jgi:hypothetical protein